jgi:hypothetical protein
MCRLRSNRLPWMGVSGGGTREARSESRVWSGRGMRGRGGRESEERRCGRVVEAVEARWRECCRVEMVVSKESQVKIP